ncbi:MAG: LysR family transcriptional regulator [Roseobacter sp.]
MRINFDFTDLETFLAVIETGSFQMGSERLGLSQSSVTRRIQKLEAVLGSKLFERTTRAVKPTLAGKRLKVRAETILNEAQETARSMLDENMVYTHQRARLITVATIPTVVSHCVVPAIRSFREKHPTTSVRLLDLAANEVAEAVAQGEADFGICSVATLEPTTQFDLLFDDQMDVALPQNHLLSDREKLTWGDLQNQSLILPARSTGNRMLIDDALARAGLPLNWSFEVTRTSTALDLVSAGLGIAPLPRSARRSVDLAKITVKPLEKPVVSRPIGFLTRIGYKASAIVDNMKQEIRASVVYQDDA